MKSESSKPTNRLINATSPYLLQHAHNPVDWYEWSDEALQKAKAENKPIFLSVGYSSCHWCHVMAHESFEDEEVAALMNKYFINIKVDREERPDIDEIYMAAVQMMTGSGGWPMSVWLTPDLHPFYGGTYFPKNDSYGRPGFKRILQAIADAWQNDRETLVKNSLELSNSVAKSFELQPASEEPDPSLLQAAFQASRNSFDEKHGGFGRAPKFPHAMELSLLLRYAQKQGSTEARHMVEHSLIKMAKGGIYDQLGGGFHRYSTDSQWLAPHFEKMLYDQGLLVRCYAEAFQVTGNHLYHQIVTETLNYVLERMTSAEGAFYSAEDADSEGEEGKYYVWSLQEIERILGPDARLFAETFDVSSTGNWEGKNILRQKREWTDIAKSFDLDLLTFSNKIELAKEKLLQARGKRVAPGLDDKCLTDWNGLMISAFVMGYKISYEQKYLDAAVRAGRFFSENMFAGDDLYHSYSRGKRKIKGYLNDYSFMIAAALDLYQVTFDIHWINWAKKLEELAGRYFSAEGGGYYFTRAGQDNLIARSKSPFDNALPSGNSVMAANLIRLSELTGETSYLDTGEKTVKSFLSHLKQYPQGYSEMLMAVDYLIGPRKQIVLAGEKNIEFEKSLSYLYGHFLPRTVITYNDGRKETLKEMPMLADKGSPDERLQIYVCENFTCQLPVSTAVELEKLLGPVKS